MVCSLSVNVFAAPAPSRTLYVGDLAPFSDSDKTTCFKYYEQEPNGCARVVFGSDTDMVRYVFTDFNGDGVIVVKVKNGTVKIEFDNYSESQVIKYTYTKSRY